MKPFYQAEIPFTGHHREYAPAELRMVIEWSGLSVEQFEVFEERKFKVKSLLTLAQKIMMLRVRNSRPYLWCTAKKPITNTAG